VENFVTIVDKNFLPQVIVMLNSLCRFSTEYKVWVFCMDEVSITELSSEQSNLKSCSLISIDKLITDEIAEARKNRTHGEFIWTLTPFLYSYVFDLDNSISRITYLDADLYFNKSPEILLDLFSKSKKQIFLTPHGFPPHEDLSELVGKFCVQFLTVSREADAFLGWWQTRCLEWCGSVPTDGKFGDQKYLDLVPELFPTLYFSLENIELTQGPWNMKRFIPSDSVFFHFHGVRIKNTNIIISGILPDKLYMKDLYFDYLLKLFDIIKNSDARFMQYRIFKNFPQIDRADLYRLVSWLLGLNLIVFTEKKLRRHF
jgi:hypothetical protein